MSWKEDTEPTLSSQRTPLLQTVVVLVCTNSTDCFSSEEQNDILGILNQQNIRVKEYIKQKAVF
jgi:hypothetical protein